MFASTPEKKISAINTINTLKPPTTPDAMERYTQREKNLRMEAYKAEEKVKELQIKICGLERERKEFRDIEQAYSDRWDTLEAEKEAAQEEASEFEQERNAALAQASSLQQANQSLNNSVQALTAEVTEPRGANSGLLRTLNNKWA
jgi:chromosome segregation ATPase